MLITEAKNCPIMEKDNSLIKLVESKECNQGKKQIQRSINMVSTITKELDQDEKAKIAETMTSCEPVHPRPEEWIYLVIDQGSISGVEEKISLVLAPALAAIGLKVLVIFEQSYTRANGALCSLESISSFQVCSSLKEVYDMLNSTGYCIAGENEDFAPVNKILRHCKEIMPKNNYPPFIVASVFSEMHSQKISALVYMVKYGKRSIFQDKTEAEGTARTILSSKTAKVSALLVSTDNVLGKAIGDCMEVAEIIDCLKGNGPSDVVQLVSALGSELLQFIRNTTKVEGKNMILDVIKNGKALKKFHSMLIRQNVNRIRAHYLCFVNVNFVLPQTLYQRDVCLDKLGYIQELNSEILTMVYEELLNRNSPHPGLGLVLLKSVGDKIRKGEAWLKIYHQKRHLSNEINLLNGVISVGESQKKRVLIDKRLFHSKKFLLMEEEN